ncbi:disulfide bond formation protein B [Streptomyces sp. NPDC051907]|uniref:disulfide bond formation protein B n=1 Tax=Streptomyces sp. NPDC051907 TaxID=3155284 RepID=UPI00342F9AD3
MAPLSSTLPQATRNGVRGRIQYWAACLFVAGWAGVLCGGLYFQYTRAQYPCPLCVVQRMFMALACIGASHIVRQGLNGAIARRDYMMGWGLALVACAGGSFAAWRQTLQQLPPGAAGPEAALWDMHLYAWAWVLFQVSIAAIGALLVFAHATTDRRIPEYGAYQTVGRFVLWFLGIVIALSVVAALLKNGLPAFASAR